MEVYIPLAEACDYCVPMSCFTDSLVDKSLGMQPNSYFHTTYHAGSDSESDSFVDESLSMQPNGYFHTTYYAGSVSESNPLVHKSHSL